MEQNETPCLECNGKMRIHYLDLSTTYFICDKCKYFILKAKEGLRTYYVVITNGDKQQPTEDQMSSEQEESTEQEEEKEEEKEDIAKYVFGEQKKRFNLSSEALLLHAWLKKH